MLIVSLSLLPCIPRLTKIINGGATTKGKHRDEICGTHPQNRINKAKILIKYVGRAGRTIDLGIYGDVTLQLHSLYYRSKQQDSLGSHAKTCILCGG